MISVFKVDKYDVKNKKTRVLQNLQQRIYLNFMQMCFHAFATNMYQVVMERDGIEGLEK